MRFDHALDARSRRSSTSTRASATSIRRCPFCAAPASRSRTAAMWAHGRRRRPAAEPSRRMASGTSRACSTSACRRRSRRRSASVADRVSLGRARRGATGAQPARSSYDRSGKFCIGPRKRPRAGRVRRRRPRALRGPGRGVRAAQSWAPRGPRVRLGRRLRPRLAGRSRRAPRVRIHCGRRGVPTALCVLPRWRWTCRALKVLPIRHTRARATAQIQAYDDMIARCYFDRETASRLADSGATRRNTFRERVERPLGDLRRARPATHPAWPAEV